MWPPFVSSTRPRCGSVGAGWRSAKWKRRYRTFHPLQKTAPVPTRPRRHRPRWHRSPPRETPCFSPTIFLLRGQKIPVVRFVGRTHDHEIPTDQSYGPRFAPVEGWPSLALTFSWAPRTSQIIAGKKYARTCLLARTGPCHPICAGFVGGVGRYGLCADHRRPCPTSPIRPLRPAATHRRFVQPVAGIRPVRCQPLAARAARGSTGHRSHLQPPLTGIFQ